MFKAILIDDEPNNLKTLENDLRNYCPQIQIMACCTSGKEGLINIHKHQPDVVFLDIQMPAMTGFEMLQCLGNISFNIIFTTAHQEFAVDAFRVSQVVDYLIKPIKREHLIEAVNRITLRTEKGISPQNLEMLKMNYYKANSILPLPASNGIDLIPIEDILYASSEGNYISIYTSKGKTSNSPYCSFTLSFLEESLPNSIFCRIHQSYLVNITQAINYDRNEKFVVMKNKEELPVSRGGRAKLLSMLNYK